MDIKAEDLANSLEQTLSREFPEDQVLPQELEGVIQALVNSIGWAVLRSASKQDPGEPYEHEVTTLTTSDQFSSEWMSRDEIQERIENTSGLSGEMAEHALRAIERTIQSHLKSGEDVVEVEHIGCIRPADSDGLVIELAEELQLVPVEQQSDS